MHLEPIRPPEAPFPRFITKSKLADLLGVSTRTVTSYISAGYLPAPHRLGRDAAWPVEALRDLLSKSDKAPMPASIHTRLQGSLDLIDKDGLGVSDVEARKARIAAGLLLDEGADFEVDWRPQVHARNALLRKSARDHEEEARGHHWSTDESRQLKRFAAQLRDELDHNERMLDDQFLPPHSETQVLGSMPLVRGPVFTVRHPQEPREVHRCVSWAPSGSESTLTYEGPELRQDDGLLFSVLVRVAADARPGRLVGFSARALCTELYGSDSGPLRTQLRTAIGRLQSGRVTFPGFTVQLVGRFEHPKRGLWAVALDRDVLRLFNNDQHIWLKLDAVLFYGTGLTAWLYRYISSQTTLWPTKVARLHALSGSTATSKSFREMLRKSLRALTAGGELDTGWYIDAAEMVRWCKPLKPEKHLQVAA